MITLENIKLFFTKHPEWYDRKWQALGRADEWADDNGIVEDISLDDIFKDDLLVAKFREEFENDHEHFKIWDETVEKLRRKTRK